MEAHMLKRSVVCGLTAVILLLGINTGTEAAVVGPSSVTAPASAMTPIRWVCGRYRCAYIPNYTGVVVVRPYMRGWAPPPSPHCNYVRGRRGRWVLVCP
jgi:hypothetical protein